MQINELKTFKTSTDHKPFRILANGRAVNLSTGVLSTKQSNIIHHPVYWDRPRTFARQAKEFLETNNPGIPIRIEYH